MADLRARRDELERPLRVATKYHTLTADFFARHGLADSLLIDAEGTLEAAPIIGYADLIVDLVSTGTTLRDNQLRTLSDGLLLESQAVLVANRRMLKRRPEVKAMARLLLEFVEAHIRAAGALSIFANLRGESPEAIAGRMFAQGVIGGLQGPTIAPIITREGGDWYGVHIVVRREQLSQAIAELRAVGGSGVVVSPVTYIFEEEPAAYRAMLAALEEPETIDD
jgi:ATP phosphoribosyltransferase